MFYFNRVLAILKTNGENSDEQITFSVFLLRKTESPFCKRINGLKDIRQFWDTPYNISHIMHEDVLMNCNRLCTYILWILTEVGLVVNETVGSFLLQRKRKDKYIIQFRAHFNFVSLIPRNFQQLWPAKTEIFISSLSVNAILSLQCNSISTMRTIIIDQIIRATRSCGT